jgi:hypothetical protein
MIRKYLAYFLLNKKVKGDYEYHDWLLALK